MSESPTGTVTFFFSDVEGSTKHLQRLGTEGYGRLLGEHRRLVREVLVAHGGNEISTEGDSFFAIFSSAGDAVVAGAHSQRLHDGFELQPRIGIHTGEAVLREGVHVGLDVHLAARISAAANGGQVLMSAATHELAPDQVARDLGEHRLKDLERLIRLYQLGLDEFPPVRSLRVVRLPVPGTSLIGRDRELADVATLLERAEVRLLTMTGPGGSGKTRLAIAAASAGASEFTDGSRWVGLAPLAEPDEMWAALAVSLETRRHPLEYLSDRELLLVFDNGEHLPGIGERVSQILAAAPRVVVIATSREPLRVGGEWVYPVDPLRSDDSVELFVARAAAAGRTVEPDETIRALCGRLDDLPLAVELAAARTTVLSPAKILERLDRHLPALATGGSDAPARQRTLEATIAWSYDLCNDEEQALFVRLGVFVGGSTLEAAETVCDADLDVLASLAAKQLVRLRDDRYWMLETIHRFAQDRLAELPDAADLELRHGAFYVSVSESTYDEMYQRWMPTDLVQRLGEDQRNFEVAIERAIARGDMDSAIGIAATFQGVYEARGLADAWWQMLHDIFGSAPVETIAQVMMVRLNGLECLSFAASMQAVRGDPVGARARTQSYLDVARDWHNVDLEAWALFSLAELDADPHSARDTLLHAERLVAMSHDPRPVLAAWIGGRLAMVDLESGDFASARRISERMAESDDLFTRMNAFSRLASAELALGNEAAARTALARYLEGHGTAAVWPDTCWMLAALSASTDPELAALFVGATARIEVESGEFAAPGGLFEQPFRVETSDTVRRRLGDRVFNRLCQEGRDTPIHLLLERAGMPHQGTGG